MENIESWFAEVIGLEYMQETGFGIDNYQGEDMLVTRLSNKDNFIIIIKDYLVTFLVIIDDNNLDFVNDIDLDNIFDTLIINFTNSEGIMVTKMEYITVNFPDRDYNLVDSNHMVVHIQFTKDNCIFNMD